MTDLPTDDVSGLVMDRASPLAQSHDFDSVANGCKRIPQLMAEHRQEFVFTSVRLAYPRIQQRVIQAYGNALGKFRSQRFLGAAEGASGGKPQQKHPERPSAREQWKHRCVVDRKIEFYQAVRRLPRFGDSQRGETAREPDPFDPALLQRARHRFSQLLIKKLRYQCGLARARVAAS